MSRRAISTEEIQQAILASATSLFLEKGIYETEMTEIARRADLSLSTLYRYAVDKNQLAFRVVTALMRDLTSSSFEMEKIPGELGIDRLRRLQFMILDECERRPEVMVVINEFDSLYRGPYPDIPEAADYVILMQRHANQALQFVLEAILDGSMKHIEDPQLFSSTIQNMTLGLCLRFFPRETHYREEHRSAARRMIEEAIGRMLEAVRT